MLEISNSDWVFESYERNEWKMLEFVNYFLYCCLHSYISYVYILIFQVEVIWTYFDLYFPREMVLLGNFTACRVPAIVVLGCFIISLHLL